MVIAAPTISFIICTRNRAGVLERCLDAVEAAARRRPDRIVEIVIVDNGSTDGTPAVAARFAARARVPVLSIREMRPGLGAARNAGIAASSGRLLVFTDDDCVLDRDYVTDLLGHVAIEAGPTLRGGRVDLGDVRDLPLTIKTSDHHETYRAGRFPGGFIHGCNLMVPRAILDRIGPFDPHFGVGAALRSAEDTDLILRAHRAGFAVEYVPDMAVRHFHGRRSRDDAARLILAYSFGNGAIYAKHGPRLRWLLKYPFWTLRAALIPNAAEAMADRHGVSEWRILRSNCAGAWSFLTSRLRPPAREPERIGEEPPPRLTAPDVARAQAGL